MLIGILILGPPPLPPGFGNMGYIPSFTYARISAEPIYRERIIELLIRLGSWLLMRMEMCGLRILRGE